MARRPAVARARPRREAVRWRRQGRTHTAHGSDRRAARATARSDKLQAGARGETVLQCPRSGFEQWRMHAGAAPTLAGPRRRLAAGRRVGRTCGLGQAPRRRPSPAGLGRPGARRRPQSTINMAAGRWPCQWRDGDMASAFNRSTAPRPANMLLLTRSRVHQAPSAIHQGHQSGTPGTPGYTSTWRQARVQGMRTASRLGHERRPPTFVDGHNTGRPVNMTSRHTT
jgi:hypothetical protein